MTSQLNVDTIADKAGSGPVGLHKQHAAKAWSNFDQRESLSVSDSFNLSSQSDVEAGNIAITLSNSMSDGNYVVADFICPTPEARSLFPADFIIWVDTIKEGRFDDTNKMFVKPDKYDFHVTTQDAKNWAPKIFEKLK